MILKFNVTVKRPKGLDPKYIAWLLKKDNNTAPCFIFTLNGVGIPYDYIPKVFFYAGIKVSSARLPNPWDFENDKVSLSYDFKNASSFIKI